MKQPRIDGLYIFDDRNSEPPDKGGSPTDLSDKKMNEAYRRDNGRFCPVCGSTLIDWEESNRDVPDSIVLYMECSDCCATWEEFFSFVYIKNVKKGD